ncbi:sensor protein cssS [Desulfocucumis palustris]|uniref:histidine kinase n=1 Tax=Desulfocucumis palustris TaxID=1898651 RepID=A0A2L2XAM2_9FIRM|nr:HAMP domain-containing sensor histidine kinase [Desulfocucumis palustris]GBF33245.1 sensor protein cssS [Desulfocucumis palustris]
MKKFPLTIKIWLALFLTSFLLYIIFLLIIPDIIRSFFTLPLMGSAPPSGLIDKERQNFARNFPVRQFILLDNGTTLPEKALEMLPAFLLQEISRNAKSQQQPFRKYEYINDQVRYHYVINKVEAYGHPLYQISFLAKSEENIFVQRLLLQFMLFAGGALILSWFASLFIARYLTRPLVQMERHVKRIADRDWHEPLQVKNDDEFGQLGQSIESMRRQLIRQEEIQQSMMQNISHELKTPVMVIRSYAQAMQDGLYPSGDLAGSIKVIDDEGARLENLIKQLLCLTRLDYLSTQKPVNNVIRLDEFIKENVERMRYRRLEIDWDLNLQPVEILGDEEKWRVLVENILDNNLRYAHSCIRISLSAEKEKNEIIIRFCNDGSKIEPNVLDKIFQPFRKGQEGKYGLGLHIAQRIIKLHQGEIRLDNMDEEKNWVCTNIKLPLYQIT